MVKVYERRAKEHVVPLRSLDPVGVVVRLESEVEWVDRDGREASPPDYDMLPDPDAVLRREVSPRLDLIRFRSDKTFVAGGLWRGFREWEVELGTMLDWEKGVD
jgi:hypothetical protein